MSDQDKAWLRHIGQTICDEWVRSQRRYSFDAGFSAGTESLAARIKELEAEQERAFGMLALYGVPKERAKTVANGIDVLTTRFRKAEAAMESGLDAAVAGKDAAERDAGLQDRWIIVKECAVTLRQGERPLLAYASLPNSAIYDSEDEVRDAIVAANTELGWVMCRMSQVFAFDAAKEQP